MPMGETRVRMNEKKIQNLLPSEIQLATMRSENKKCGSPLVAKSKSMRAAAGNKKL
jgi:hypothetical protein